ASTCCSPTSARKPVMRARLAALAAPVVALALLAGCATDKNSIRASGTIEMDEIDVASYIGGRLVKLYANEGDTVAVGDTLAVLDRGEIAAELAAQAAQAERAQSQAKDLAQGARPSELVIAREQLRAAEADLQLAQLSFDRTDKLTRSGVAAPADLDRARTQRDAAQARAAAAREQVRLQEDGFRRQQVTAAKQGATAAMAQLAGARSRASELVLLSPHAGVVLLTNYVEGELVPPSSPVVSLGDPDSLWMRVYVAAPQLTRLRLGATAEVRPIGVKQPFPGRVVSIANEAEFTPRAALTEEEQANLVFAVKLSLGRSQGALKAGLPADARIATAK
ncbi:MAG: efflux RND transporter periplasmic adaptor subunit, partial [Gemmatimonadetes bacterium]|nr:efflux RND transporter periplasmic adaptor subunit [Gemmatimonadota bacterium]